MKKTFLVIGVVLVLAIAMIGLTGCDNNKGIIGSWSTKLYSTEYVYTFNEDKTGNYNAGGTVMNFTYEDDGKKVSILYTGNTDASSYEYRIEGNKLIIKDSFGSDVEYTKK